MPRAFSTSPNCLNAARSSFPAASASASPWAAPSCAIPKVFLFDEPLSNLDAKLRVQMRTEIKRVHQKVKTTTVYVTHDQVEAMTLADRVVVMNRRQDRADRHAARTLPPSQDAFCRRVHRLAGDEFHAVPGSSRLVRAARAPFGHAGVSRTRSREARYRRSAGKEVVFGLRPEHITEPRHNGRGRWLRFQRHFGCRRADGHGNDGVFHDRWGRVLRPCRTD